MISGIPVRKLKFALLLMAPVLLIIATPSFASIQGGSQQLAVGQAAAVSIDLCAKSGTVTMPDTSGIPVWGFALKPSGVDCSDLSVVGELPGPTLDVGEGDTVTVTLYNELSENVSIIFPGQDLLPDEVGAPAEGGTATYSFTAAKPGTYLYESGVNPQKQVQMGLYGALVIRPATSGQAYNDEDGRSLFDEEAVLVLSEIDPDFHAAVEAEESYDLLNYNPRYFLINGKAFPETDAILAEPGRRVLFRYLNAGFLNHTLQLLGLYQTVIARDGYLLNFAYDTFSQTIVSGETYDLIATIPSDGLPGTKYPLYVRSRSMHTYQGDIFPGGMMTFVTVQSSTLDSDNDGFADAVEEYLGTDALDACPDETGVHDAWPLDINMDRAITVAGDAINFRGRIGASPATAGWWQRLDLSMDGAITVAGDALMYREMVGESCG